ncbi:MAG: zinc-ribbon domain-containing protein [Pseudomonadota bacterium]
MIITCEKCSTNFNLDDSLVKDTGSKVRCSLCKHIFTAYPTPQEEPSLTPGVIPGMIPDTLDTEDPFDTPDLSDTAPSDTDLFKSDEDDFSIQENDLAIESQDLEIEDVGLEIEDSSLEIQDTSSELESTGLQNDDFSLDIESSGLEIETSGLEMEGDEVSGLEMEGDEPDDDVADFEMEDDFSFEEDNFEIKADDNEVADLEMESSDEDTRIEVDDQMEFYAEPEENPDDGIDETGDGEADFDGIEFDIEDNGPEYDEAPNEDIPDKNIIDEDEFELEFDIEEDVDEDETDSMDDLPNAIHAESAEQIDSEYKSPMITPEDDFSEYDEVLDQETEPEVDLIDEEPIDIDDSIDGKPGEKQEEKQDVLAANKGATKRHSPHTRRIKKKKPLVGTPVLILVLIFFLVASAYVAGIMTGYKIPYLSDIKIPFIEQLLKKAPAETSDVAPIPNQKSVNGRFVTNSSAGTLFVITGIVENPTMTAFSHIEIKGSLFTKGNKEVKTKNAFCGNIITEEMLKTGTMADIDNILIVKEGNHNTNVKIKPGASIPFMVVFSELPEKLQNFIVKVNSFEKTN